MKKKINYNHTKKRIGNIKKLKRDMFFFQKKKKRNESFYFRNETALE